jgi:ATP-dependent exoDNAse (exonuclease V) beta subunit
MTNKTKGTILFNEELHTYTNTEENTKYKSVTKWIENYKDKFVANSTNTAKTMKNLNMTYEEVVEYWRLNNERSKIRGTFIHKGIEDYLLNGTVISHPEIPFDYLDKILKKRGTKYVEDILYNHNLKLAGQTDLIIEYKNCFDIYDWKTNEKDLHKCYMNNKLKIPFNYLPASSYSEYCIQLGIYSIFAEMYYKKPVRNAYILHIYNGSTEINITKDCKKVIKTLKEIWK